MKNLTHEIPTGKQSILLVKDIAPSGTNRTITDEQLAEMTESVRTHGVIQPLVVRPVACVTDERLRKAAGKASHVLVAGERRWRSARTVGLEKVQVVIRELSDRESLELQAIENLQRKDLTDIEEARQYRRLLDCGMKAEELASRVSKSRAHVYNCLKLLELPKDAQDALNSGKLDRAVALLIARITHPDARKEATRQILAGRSVFKGPLTQPSGRIMPVWRRRGLNRFFGMPGIHGAASYRRTGGMSGRVQAVQSSHTIFI